MFTQGTHRYVNPATAISIIVLAAGISMLGSGMYRTAQSWNWVLHTREVLQHVNGTASLVNQVDALQKSLRLAYDEQDAAAFRAMLAELPREQQALVRLTRDNPLQQQTLADFRRASERYAQTLQAGLARNGPYPGKDAERAMRQQIAAQVAALRGEEERLLALREASVERDRNGMIAAAAAVSILSIVLLLLIRSMARRETEVLIAERANLDATLRSIGEAVIAIDVQGRVRFMNRVAEQMLGCDEAHAAGRQLDGVIRPRILPDGFPLVPVLSKVLSSKQPAASVALSATAPAPPHAVRDWMLSCHPIAVGEALYGAVISLMDVTDLKQAQRELSEANRLLELRVQERTAQLADANTELRAFAHTVAHDLRAPLRNLQGYAAALLEDEAPTLSASGSGFLKRMGVVTQRMERLISDLLAYSQLSRAELRLEPVGLDEVVQRALHDLAAQIDASGARIEVAAPLPEVLGAEAVLVQVFGNLIGNALKFVAPGTRPDIRMDGRVEGRMAIVWIADQGIGIPADQRERVFDVFERLHGEEQYPGTGIGLAIVRKGLERLGGSIRVEPAPVGTTFRLCLPLAARASQEHRAATG